MRIVKCSASAIKTYYYCPFKYWMEKILQMESTAGKAALQGTIVHQVFEWMGKLKRKGKTHIDTEWLLDQAWEMHVKRNPEIAIRRVTSRGEAADYKKCRNSITEVLSRHHNPYDLKIIDSERWFELPMPGKEWECLDENGKISQFTARGFIDLVHEIDSDTIEIVDWKTGDRSDFYTREKHDYETLSRDIQVRLYHFAATELYPQYKNVIVTFYFTSDGGPITIPLEPTDIFPTIEYLWKFFQTVKNDTLIIRNRSWKCKMCSFERSGACQRVWSDLHTLGSKYVEKKYTKLTFNQQKLNTN